MPEALKSESATARSAFEIPCDVLSHLHFWLLSKGDRCNTTSQNVAFRYSIPYLFLSQHIFTLLMQRLFCSARKQKSFSFCSQIFGNLLLSDMCYLQLLLTVVIVMF